MVPRYVSATQAASLLGVSTKTISRWVTSGKLQATHPSPNRVLIATSEIERLQREQVSTEALGPTLLDSHIDIMQSELDALRKTAARALDLPAALKDVTARIDALVDSLKQITTRLDRLEDRLELLEHVQQQAPVPEQGPRMDMQPTQPVTAQTPSDASVDHVNTSRETPTQPVTTQTPSAIPPGSVQAHQFAREHGVNERTFREHITKGIRGKRVEALERPKPGRPRETERWLTPAQQAEARAFWDRHGVRYTLSTSDQLPEGYVPFIAFLDQHGINRNQAEAARKAGFIAVEHGMLSPQGQRDVWVQFHAEPDFRACDRCPHTV